MQYLPTQNFQTGGIHRDCNYWATVAYIKANQRNVHMPSNHADRIWPIHSQYIHNDYPWSLSIIHDRVHVEMMLGWSFFFSPFCLLLATFFLRWHCDWNIKLTHTFCQHMQCPKLTFLMWPWAALTATARYANHCTRLPLSETTLFECTQSSVCFWASTDMSTAPSLLKGNAYDP